MDKAALDYVLETARRDDINITQEQGRKSLGALGLTGQMALARIGLFLTDLHIAYSSIRAQPNWQTDTNSASCSRPLVSIDWSWHA